jgi:hypothetical protein
MRQSDIDAAKQPWVGLYWDTLSDFAGSNSRTGPEDRKPMIREELLKDPVVRDNPICWTYLRAEALGYYSPELAIIEMVKMLAEVIQLQHDQIVKLREMTPITITVKAQDCTEELRQELESLEDLLANGGGCDSGGTSARAEFLRQKLKGRG